MTSNTKGFTIRKCIGAIRINMMIIHIPVAPNGSFASTIFMPLVSLAPTFTLSFTPFESSILNRVRKIRHFILQSNLLPIIKERKPLCQS